MIQHSVFSQDTPPYLIINDNDTLAVVTLDQIRGANYFFAEREYCWEIADSLYSSLLFAEQILNTQDNTIEELIDDIDTLNFNLDNSQMLSVELNQKVRRKNIWGLCSTGSVVILLTILILL